MPSLTPPADPGRLTMSTGPARPARPRDKIADAIPAAAPADLIASAIPGISRSRTRRVISGVRSPGVRPVPPRSEEHTSELQSRLHLVCRLLLEKKKRQHTFYSPFKYHNPLTS